MFACNLFAQGTLRIQSRSLVFGHYNCVGYTFSSLIICVEVVVPEERAPIKNNASGLVGVVDLEIVLSEVLIVLSVVVDVRPDLYQEISTEV